MRCFELIEHAVDRLGLLANCWAAKVRGLGEHTVVIPLDVGDVVFAQDGVHLVEHVGVGTGVRKVEHLLVSKLWWHATARLQNPFRMRAVEVAVGVHHLALKPKTELHASRVHGFDEGAKAVRPDIRADHPVAEAGKVVATSTEPTVVEHEAFDTDFGGSIGKRGELF